MTLSERKYWLTAAFLLVFSLSGLAMAATPPDAEMAAAQAAIANAERAKARGPAADILAQARASFAQANEAMARKKYKDALRLAEEARAQADLAQAKARLVSAQEGFEERSTRNAELRRQLLVVPEQRQ